MENIRGTVPEKNCGDIDAQLKRIGKLLAESNRDDYESLLKRLQQARMQFHELLAERMADPFNAQLATTEHETLPQMQSLTRNANADLRSLGLAVQCPKTGDPAVLHASPAPTVSGGRFQVTLISSERNRKKTFSSKELFVVTLMANPVRREGLAEYWAERMRPTTRQINDSVDRNP